LVCKKLSKKIKLFCVKQYFKIYCCPASVIAVLPHSIINHAVCSDLETSRKSKKGPAATQGKILGSEK
jgi:hypothetical protein